MEDIQKVVEDQREGRSEQPRVRKKNSRSLSPEKRPSRFSSMIKSLSSRSLSRGRRNTIQLQILEAKQALEEQKMGIPKEVELETKPKAAPGRVSQSQDKHTASRRGSSLSSPARHNRMIKMRSRSLSPEKSSNSKDKPKESQPKPEEDIIPEKRQDIPEKRREKPKEGRTGRTKSRRMPQKTKSRSHSPDRKRTTKHKIPDKTRSRSASPPRRHRSRHNLDATRRSSADKKASTRRAIERKKSRSESPPRRTPKHSQSRVKRRPSSVHNRRIPRGNRNIEKHLKRGEGLAARHSFSRQRTRDKLTPQTSTTTTRQRFGDRLGGAHSEHSPVRTNTRRKEKSNAVARSNTKEELRRNGTMDSSSGRRSHDDSRKGKQTMDSSSGRRSKDDSKKGKQNMDSSSGRQSSGDSKRRNQALDSSSGQSQEAVEWRRAKTLDSTMSKHRKPEGDTLEWRRSKTVDSNLDTSGGGPRRHRINRSHRGRKCQQRDQNNNNATENLATNKEECEADSEDAHSDTERQTEDNQIVEAGNKKKGRGNVAKHALQLIKKTVLGGKKAEDDETRESKTDSNLTGVNTEVSATE